MQIASQNSPIHNIEVVEMLEREQQLSAVESATLLVEPLLALEMVEELSAIHETAYTGEFNVSGTQMVLTPRPSKASARIGN